MPFSLRRSSSERDGRAVAARTRDVLATHPDWVWPHGLASAKATGAAAGVMDGGAAATSEASWTRLVTVGRATDAIVDRRGLVTPVRGGWSLDWWVGGDDRWYFPSREVTVRQGLFEGTPIVLTRLRVPGGDIEHRVMALQGPPLIDRAPIGVVDVFNGARTPVVLALAIRPADPTGVNRIDRIELADDVVLINGEPALFLPVAPRAAALGDHTADLAEMVTSESTQRRQRAEVECPQGLAQAALLFPLTHQTRIRFGLPLEPLARGAVASVGAEADVAADESGAATAARSGSAVLSLLPPVDPVTSGWHKHADVGARFKLPDTRLAEVFGAVRQFLLGHAAASGPPTPEAALVLTALAELGRTDEGERWYQGWLDNMGLDASFGGFRSRPGAEAVALKALGDGWALSHDRDVFEPHIGGVAKGAHQLERQSRKGQSKKGGGLGAYSPPDAPAALAAAVRLLRGLDQSDAADLVGERLARLDQRGPNPTPTPGSEFGAITDASPAVLALAAAHTKLVAGDPVGAWTGLADVLDRGSPTWTWSGSYLSSGSADGSGDGGADELGDGHDVGAAARLVSLIRAMVVHEVSDGAATGGGGESAPTVLALAAGMVPDFYGQNLEVHDAPTWAGTMSYALRWHGERPAILWELEPWPDAPVPEVRLTSPTLDPAWSTTELNGETLLALPPSAPAGYVPRTAVKLDPEPDFGDELGEASEEVIDLSGGPTGPIAATGVSETSVSLPSPGRKANSDPDATTGADPTSKVDPSSGSSPAAEAAPATAVTQSEEIAQNGEAEGGEAASPDSVADPVDDGDGVVDPGGSFQ